MNKPTIKSLTEQLAEEKRLRQQAEDANISLQSKIAGSPTLQDKLNMANATVAELMRKIEELKNDLSDTLTIKTNYFNKNCELTKEVETLKELAHTRLHELTCKAESLKSLHAQHDTLKSDYALLEEKYYTQSDNYTEVNKEYKDLLDKFTEISAENYALKAEIERTNRHINLAENQLQKEQQPLVVNHYHNCTINK